MLSMDKLECFVLIYCVLRFCNSDTDPTDFTEINCKELDGGVNPIVMVNMVFHTFYCGNVRI